VCAQHLGWRAVISCIHPVMTRALRNGSQVMKSLVVVLLLATWLRGQAAGIKDVEVTGVAGESWLNHLHRTFEETSMGKTGRLGPVISTGGAETPGWRRRLSADSTTQNVTLKGSDLYRLNCWGCHGEFGLGAPPEINSVINPTRAASIVVTMEKMKRLGMDISRADAAEMANQSKASLLQRLHKGGTDMPPFPHLSEPEVRAIFTYLKQLAGVPGAEKQQAVVEESRARVGEHIVKSTCHICHNAAGANPNPEQLLNGAIPPLSSLTTRTSLPEFEQKVRNGAPIMMGMSPSPFRGRMPVFYYLGEDEVADAYLYLTLYPPAVLDPVIAGPEPNQAASKVVPGVPNSEPTTALAPRKDGDMIMVASPVAAEIFVALLLAGGLGFTVQEIRRLTAESYHRKVLVMGNGNIALRATRSTPSESRPGRAGPLTESALSDNVVAVNANAHDKRAVSYSRFRDSDYRAFESSWLARRLEKEDRVA
jgi:mono/diheme cytochrome c family protein